eukprot:12902553-Alexandrium_andersonii.AAC.1
MGVEQSAPRTCAIAQDVRSVNCAGPGTNSNLASKAVDGCVLRRCSRRSPICRGNGPTSAPEALLGGGPGGGALPRKTDYNDRCRRR